MTSLEPVSSSKMSLLHGVGNCEVESSWNVMAQGDARKGKWSGNWRMEWVASTLHTTSEHVSSITTADAHTSAASSRLNWRPCRFKWIRPFRQKTKSGFCACAITFQTQSTPPNNGECTCLFWVSLPLFLVCHTRTAHCTLSSRICVGDCSRRPELSVTYKLACSSYKTRLVQPS